MITNETEAARYITEQFQQQGFQVRSVIHTYDERIVVDTDFGVYAMHIGSDDDCYQFVNNSGLSSSIVSFELS